MRWRRGASLKVCEFLCIMNDDIRPQWIVTNFEARGGFEVARGSEKMINCKRFRRSRESNTLAKNMRYEMFDDKIVVMLCVHLITSLMRG